MKSLSLLISLFVFTTNIIAQTSRGVSITQSSQQEESKYRMLVIGISKYKNIDPLQYADKDAITFYNFMQKAYKNKFNNQNCKLLINEEATSAAIYSEGLMWLTQESSKGETIIIYFAGHGDVENTTINKDAFLLAYDAPKTVYWAGGTIQISVLENFINTLVVQNNAKVILIVDACRSGKLAGGANGLSTTSLVLQKQWTNVTKILSSQPGEASLEGIKWNSGGGVFTYFLIKGLLNEADRDKDKIISGLELYFYLSDKVKTETNNLQTPLIIGNMSESIFFIDSLSFVNNNDDTNRIYFNQINKNSILNDSINEESISNKELKFFYKKFNECIARKHLVRLDSLSNDLSAYDYYQKIELVDKNGSCDRNARRKLLSSLQFRYMEQINQYIETGQSAILFSESKLKKLIFIEIQLAYRLIEKENPNFNNIKVAYYTLLMSDKEYRLTNGQNDVINIMDTCITLMPQNALLYLIKGELLESAGIIEDAKKCYEKALELTPKFIFPIQWMARYEFNKGNYQKALDYMSVIDYSNLEFNNFMTWHEVLMTSLYKTNDLKSLSQYFTNVDSLVYIKYKGSPKSFIALANLFQNFRLKTDTTAFYLKDKEVRLIESAKNVENNIVLYRKFESEADSMIHRIIFVESLVNYYEFGDKDSLKTYQDKQIIEQNGLCKLRPVMRNYIWLLWSLNKFNKLDEAFEVLEILFKMNNFDAKMIENDDFKYLIQDDRYQKMKMKYIDKQIKH